jgi:hypothetical protein
LPRSPGPYQVAEAFCVYDATDRALAYVNVDTAERGANTERMTKVETRRSAARIAKMPGLMGALADDIMRKLR